MGKLGRGVGALSFSPSLSSSKLVLTNSLSSYVILQINHCLSSFPLENGY